MACVTLYQSSESVPRKKDGADHLHLYVSTDLLLARETLLAMSAASVPKALVVSFTGTDMGGYDMGCEVITRGERLSAGLPMAYMGT